MLVGSHGYNDVDDAGMDEGVPVCQGENVPSKGVGTLPNDWHIPEAFLGSLGIQPFL